MESLHYVASLTVILGVVWGVFSYVVLRPLNTAIGNLDKSVWELRQDLRTAEQIRHGLELKVAEIDQRARSAHHRIDELMELKGVSHATHND